jgi:hypothetical protein
MLRRRGSLEWAIRLGVALAPLTVIAVVWALHHNHLLRTAHVRHAAAASRSAATLIARAELPSTPTPSTGTQESLLLHPASLVSIPAITGTTDPDSVATFRQLIAKPPATVIGSIWAVNQKHLPGMGQARRAAGPSTSTASPSARAELPTPPTPSSGARESLLFHPASLVSIPAITGTTDPDPVTTFRQLTAKPPVSSPARATSQLETTDADVVTLGEPTVMPQVSSAASAGPDPRSMRAILDRGVVAYASAKTNEDRTKGASMIQAAALMGYFQARNLLARNYPRSEAVRSAVPPEDAIRYGVGLVTDATASVEDSRGVLLALGQYFSDRGQIDLFATHLLNLLRGDTRPQLNNRIDVLLGILAEVRGACDAVARLVMANASSSGECTSTLVERLRTYIENTPPAAEEGQVRQRGLLLFSQVNR